MWTSTDAKRVGKAGHADVELSAVTAERDAGKEGLRSGLFGARVREVGYASSLRIEDRKRLHSS